MALEKNADFAKKFGERITRLREERGWTKQELAYRMNIERRQLLRIEQGTNNTSLQTAVALAKVFEATLSELLDFEYEGM
jgi:transcriptional regulator with XRE-family HTH domain